MGEQEAGETPGIFPLPSQRPNRSEQGVPRGALERSSSCFRALLRLLLRNLRVSRPKWGVNRQKPLNLDAAPH